MAIDPKLMNAQPYQPPQQLQQVLNTFPPFISQPPQGAGQQSQIDQRSWWQKFKDSIVAAAKATGEVLAGSPGGYEQIPQFEPHQQNALNYLLSQGLQDLSNPLQGFNPIAQESLRHYQENVVPALSSQFQGGRFSSPNFQQRLSQSATGLESMLAAQRAQYGQNAQQNALQQIQLGLTPQYGTYAFGATPGLFQSSANTAGKVIAKTINPVS